jgi:hypothetical protein
MVDAPEASTFELTYDPAVESAPGPRGVSP